MKIFLEHSKKLFKKILVIILTILCVFSLFLFISMIKYFSKSGQLGIEYRLNGHPTSKYHPTSIDSIQPWMTFNYLNVVYKINIDYLKTYLNINEPKYPNIRINIYARRNNIPINNFLNEIKLAITNYNRNK